MQIERCYNSKISLTVKIEYGFLRYLEGRPQTQSCTKEIGKLNILLPLIFFALLSVVSAQSFAACTPGDTGTAGNDVITCDPVNVPALTIVDGLGGNDTITLDGITAPTVTVRGDTGTDTINLINGAEVFAIEGEDDVDTINLTNGTATNVNWGAGDEGQTLDLTNVTVNGSLFFGAGMDTFALTAGTVGQSVVLGNGTNNDTAGNIFTLDGGTIGVRIDGGNFTDTINLNSGDVFEVRANDGDDTIDLSGTATAYRIYGNGGVDTINLTSGTVTTDVDWGAGDETVTLDLTNVTLGGNIVMGTGTDNFRLNAGNVGGSVLLGSSANNDTAGNIFTLAGGSIGVRIDGGSQADTINLNGGSVGSTVNGFNGTDTINLAGNATVFGINGGADVDVINLDSGTVTGNVNWGHGDETYTLDLTNVTLGGSIFMGGGMDNFTHVAGTVGADVYLGIGNNSDSASNTFTLNGGTINGRVWGGNFADTINLNSGTIGGTVFANSGTDTVNLVGTATVRDIDGGNDVDVINLTSGTVTGFVNWGAGDETVTLDLTNVTLGGSIHMGHGADNFTHTAGHVGAHVFLGVGANNGTDADTFTLAGGTIGQRLEGDQGVDTINLNSGSVGTQVRTFSGADTITLDGTATVGWIQAGADVDTITLTSGTVTNNVNWEAGDESGVLDLTNVSLGGSLIFGTGSDNFTLNAGTVGTSVILGANANSGTDADTFTMNGGIITSRIEGDQGADTLNLNGGEILNGTGVRTFTGADVINLDGTILHGGIQSGGDSDTINLTSGGVTFVDAGAGDDTGVLDLTNITLGNTATSGMGQLTLGTGSDNFTLNAGVINGNVLLGIAANNGTDADIFTMNGGVITGRIEGDQGDDTINLNGGTIQNGTSLRGFAGNDTVNLNGATIDGNIDTGVDNDTFNWSDGTLAGFFTGDTGNDAANISAATYDGTTVLDGGQFNTFVNNNGTPLDTSDDFTVADTFVDTLTFNGTNTGVSANTIRGWESVNAVNSTLNFDTLLLNGVSAINDNNVATALNVTGGDVTLSGASVLADLLGSASNETLTVTGTTVASNNIEGAGGADTISITGDASVTGGVFGGAAGHDASAAADTGDTILINTTGTVLLVDGGLGNDAIDLTAGNITNDVLGQDGDDTITVRDGATIGGVIDGGTSTAGDTLIADVGTSRTFDGADLANIENLQKDNTGTLALTGTESFSGRTTINGGTVDVDGTITTPTVAMADDTTLSVDGTVNDGAAGQVAITGSTGANTVTVTGTLLADGDLGDGADVLDVSGTLDTGAGTLALGGGDDTFTIHDGTTVTGTVDAGAGTDTFNTNINTTADIGAVQGFEILDKTGIGVLNINGTARSDFNTVNVTAGTLNVAATGSIDGVNNATISSGATLQIEGTVDFTTGGDTFDISGVVRGNGAIDMLDGNDILTLRDGTDFSGLTGGIDGNAGNDTIIIDNAAALTFDGSNIDNFENLQKDNSGDLTITGNETFTGGTTLNGGTLNIDGVLGSPTVIMANDTSLNVDGTLNDGATGQATITGSTGVNTVTVTGSLLADGDLGDGADVLDVSGTLDTGAGTLTLGDGDDTFTIHDGTTVIGTVDGGTGTDVFNTNINTTANIGATQGFETLSKTGTGILNVTGPGVSSFNTVNVNQGTVDIAGAGAITNVNSATVSAGATLNISGMFGFTPGADTFNILGTVISTANPIDLLDGNDIVTVSTTGNMTADTILGLGDDIFNLTGGVNTGDIYGDGLVANAADGDDTFNWSDGQLNSGFFGGNGSDTATISNTAVYNGTEVFDGGDDVSAADGWVDTLTYNGITATAGASTIRNWENVVINGGSLTFADNALIVGSETGLGLTISNGGILNTSGGFTLTGNLDNPSGIINSQDGNAGDRIRVSGDYTGGGQFRTDVNFTTDTADVLEVAGNVMGGETLIVLNDVSSGQASGNDVLVVEVGGTAAADAFNSASVISGIWTYDLNQVGQNFYLNGTSASLSPSATAYESYPQTLKALNQLPTLQQRVGQRRWTQTHTNMVDTDQDGIIDELDHCPNTAVKAIVDKQGCDRMLAEMLTIELEINFTNGSSQLLGNAFDEIAGLAHFMKEHPDTSVVIEGHTSTVGNAGYNQLLSEQRASKIAAQLSEVHGISVERVTAVGYGESRPKVVEIDSESAEQNRRVVAAISTTQHVVRTAQTINNTRLSLPQTAHNSQHHGFWMRLEGEQREQEAASSTTNAEYDLSRTLMQVGYDIPLTHNQKGTWIGGVTAHYTKADTDASSPAGDANVDSHGYGVGLTATWYGNNQAYADLQVQASHYETDLSSDLDPELADDLDGKGWVMSIETGKRFSQGDWSVTPQAQITYGVIDFDRFSDDFGSDVSLQEDESLVGRLGIMVDRDHKWEKDGTARRSHLYSTLNVNYQFKDKTEVDVSGTSLVFKEDAWTADLGVGGAYEWADGQWALYGETSVQTSLEHIGDSHSIKGTIGIRGKF